MDRPYYRNRILVRSDGVHFMYYGGTCFGSGRILVHVETRPADLLFYHRDYRRFCTRSVFIGSKPTASIMRELDMYVFSLVFAGM